MKLLQDEFKPRFNVPNDEPKKVKGPTISDHAKQLFETGKLSDITIKTKDDKEIKAHNFILSRSKVFDVMLNAHDTKEAIEGVIKITDTDFDVLNEMIRYLYCDEAPQLEEMALDLLTVANKYDIPGLEAECVEHLTDNVATESFAEILMIADQLNIQSLKDAAINFVITNRKVVFSTEGWKRLKAENMPLAMEVMENFVLET